MHRSVGWGLFLLAVAGTSSARASGAADRARAAETIRHEVAQLVAGLNAHDPGKTTAYDAPDVISMECGRTPTVGIDADREGFRDGFAHNPSWKVSLIDDSVDVADSEDLAVYRGAYHEDSQDHGVPTTHKTNFIAEFKRQRDGSWKMAWYSVTSMEKSHPK